MMIISVISFIRSFLRKMRDDFVAAFSAQAAFFIIISFFPFVMFLLTLVQYMPVTESDLLKILTSVIPDVIKSLVVTLVQEIYDKASGTIISITIITALWSASKGFFAIVKGLNSVYGITETRNYIKLRLISIFYTLIFAVMLIVSLGFLVFGNRIYIWISGRFAFLNELALLIISLRTVVGLCVLVVFFTALYLFIPNRKSNFMRELPGAVLTAAGWMGFSYLYSFYIDNMGNHSYMYGSLTAIVLLMIWLYACMYMMFIGAEVNVIFAGSGLTKLFQKKKQIS